MKQSKTQCPICKSDLIKDPSPDARKLDRLCFDCDFKPEAIRKFYETMFSKVPKWASADVAHFEPQQEEPIFESKEEMNPYLADVFTLVNENEMALRDHMFSPAGIKYGMLMQIARYRYVFKYAWAIPCKAALEAIAGEGPVVEVGAGSGYWAHLLDKMGCDVVAYDVTTENKYSGSGADFHHRWFDVKSGDESSVALHPDRALLLCWPPYDDDMGFNCLKNYSGDTVIFIGENGGGCTANEAFFEHLNEHFSEIERIEIPVWFGLHDGLYIFKRNKT